MQTLISRRRAVGALVIAALSFISSTRIALAHEAPCPYCGMKITQDTPTQDNETVLKSGRKRIEYKCVYCALDDANSQYKGDLTILAPSEIKGAPVIINRVGGAWSASTTAAFVMPKNLKHKVCQAQARAFTTQVAAQRYAKKSGGIVLTLAQLVALAK